MGNVENTMVKFPFTGRVECGFHYKLAVLNNSPTSNAWA